MDTTQNTHNLPMELYNWHELDDNDRDGCPIYEESTQRHIITIGYTDFAESPDEDDANGTFFGDAGRNSIFDTPGYYAEAVAVMLEDWEDAIIAPSKDRLDYVTPLRNAMAKIIYKNRDWLGRVSGFGCGDSAIDAMRLWIGESDFDNDDEDICALLQGFNEFVPYIDTRWRGYCQGDAVDGIRFMDKKSLDDGWGCEYSDSVRDAVIYMHANKDKLASILSMIDKVHNFWLGGDVFEFSIRLVAHDRLMAMNNFYASAWAHARYGDTDSCCGFYGEEDAITQALEYAECVTPTPLDKALLDFGKRCFTHYCESMQFFEFLRGELFGAIHSENKAVDEVGNDADSSQ